MMDTYEPVRGPRGGMLYDPRRLRFAGQRKQLLQRKQIGKQRFRTKCATFDRKNIIKKSFPNRKSDTKANPLKMYLTLFPKKNKSGGSLPKPFSTKFPGLKPKLHTMDILAKKRLRMKPNDEATRDSEIPNRTGTSEFVARGDRQELFENDARETDKNEQLRRSCQRTVESAYRFRQRQSEKESTFFYNFYANNASSNMHTRGRTVAKVSPRRALPVSISAMDRRSAAAPDTVEDLNQRILEQRLQRRKPRMSAA